jgi:hypothetical protein
MSNTENAKTFNLAQVMLKGVRDPRVMGRRPVADEAQEAQRRAIVLATKVPDAGGELAEIKDPHLRAKVADALDLSSVVKNAPALLDLSRALAAIGYDSSADKVRKQADYIARTYPSGSF